VGNIVKKEKEEFDVIFKGDLEALDAETSSPPLSARCLVEFRCVWY
jgi:hypothetical protein